MSLIQNLFGDIHNDFKNIPVINNSNTDLENSLEIILKQEQLNTSKLQSGSGSNQYRPMTLNDYIGQANIKNRINYFFEGCKKYGDIFPHTLITAPSGYGKTTLAEIIANMLGKKLLKTTGSQLNSQQILVDLVAECDGGIIFIDEANRIKKDVGFFMLPIMEKFEIDNKKIKPFILILATTHCGDIAKDLDALIQRCNLWLNLQQYTKQEMVDILKIYHKKQYSQKHVTDDIFNMIAENCKFTPRIAKTLLREYIYNGNFNNVLADNNIIKNSFTVTDILILKYLKTTGGASKNSIASFIKIKPQTYEYQYEPWLISNEFITVANKRRITDKGLEFLQSV